MDDTIAAFATPPGISGLAVLRLSGPESLAITEKIFTPGPLPASDSCPASRRQLCDLDGYQAMLGWVHRPDSTQVIDQAIVTRFKAPHSYTGEDVMEISQHGGSGVRRSLLAAVLEAGARLAEPGEYTKRAFINGKIDLAQSEAVMDLIESDAGQAARAAMQQLQGSLSDQVQAYIDQLYSWLSALEVDMEYPEYEDSILDSGVLGRALTELTDSLRHLEDSFTQGRILKEGLKVVLAGRPNAGKSSLLNALAGSDRSIVTDIPGTTRDTVDIEISIDGLPVKLIDTAGLRRSDDPVERIGVDRAVKALEEADLVFWLHDASSFEPSLADGLPALEDMTYMRSLAGRLPLYVLLTKQDLVRWSPDDAETARAAWKKAMPEASDLVFISSVTREGLAVLRQIISEVWQRMGSASSQMTMLTSERHRDAVRRAGEILQKVSAGSSYLEPVLAAQQLKAAAEALGQITGESVSEQLINEIFGRFCIGK